MRQNQKRQARNKARRSAMKTQVRKLSDAIAARDPAAAQKEFRVTAALLDRTAKRGTIHRNTAARRTSRLARRLNAMKAAGTPS